MKTLAIIGMGPRGLYALENVLAQLSKSKKVVEITIFESYDRLGAGPVWDENQSESNWINITERALDGITARPELWYSDICINAFPSYHQWCKFSQKDNDPDTFPPRKKLGKYLNQRCESLKKDLEKSQIIDFIRSNVKNIDVSAGTFSIETEDNIYNSEDVLLTIGHQPTQLSEQIENWKSHCAVKNEMSVYAEPYPVKQFKTLKNTTDITIGLRGFGLAMIDVMRYLVINDFGNFKVVDSETFETVYYKSKAQNLRLVPFSLDGLPLSPKPLNKSIDDWYLPTTTELQNFKSEIESAAQTTNSGDSINFLIEPIAKIAAFIFYALGERRIETAHNKSEIEAITVDYLKDEKFQHALIQDETLSTYDLINSYINMALGEAEVSLDYCLWQVWRHCQPTLYEAFSYANVSDETIKKVIALDERSKRFSYGPPIESMQQILALVDAEIMTLDYTDNPEIELSAKGWKLSSTSDKSITTSVMINSVLDAPKLLDVNSSIIKSLLQNEMIQPMHSDLGIETFPNAYVKSDDKNEHMSLAILGRLAKGSVIGVDAILECFGSRIENWAKVYVENHED